MSSPIPALLLIPGAYLLGSLSSAIILCRLRGLPDPRSQGSGNPGATNVLRYGGKGTALAVLLGDLLKGLLPTLAAVALGLPAWAIGGVALGHVFPVFFGFRGGKGVATALGAIAGIAWPLALALVGCWLVTAGVFRISSLAAIVASLVAPALAAAWLDEPAYTVAIGLMSLLLLVRHRANIRRLLAGTEPRIGRKG